MTTNHQETTTNYQKLPQGNSKQLQTTTNIQKLPANDYNKNKTVVAKTGNDHKRPQFTRK